MPTRAHRLNALAAHPGTQPVVADRIRSSVRRHERRIRMATLAAHPGTPVIVADRIRRALDNDAARGSVETTPWSDWNQVT